MTDRARYSAGTPYASREEYEADLSHADHRYECFRAGVNRRYRNSPGIWPAWLKVYLD